MSCSVVPQGLNDAIQRLHSGHRVYSGRFQRRQRWSCGATTLSNATMACAHRAINLRGDKTLEGLLDRLNEWLLSISHSNVLRGINPTLLSRSATTEYGRRSSFSAAPSPNQESAGTPAKVVERPSLETVSTFTNPSITPSQWSGGAPR